MGHLNQILALTKADGFAFPRALQMLLYKSCGGLVSALSDADLIPGDVLGVKHSLPTSLSPSAGVGQVELGLLLPVSP